MSNDHAAAFAALMQRTDAQIKDIFHLGIHRPIYIRRMFDELSSDAREYMNRLFKVACLTSNIRKEDSSRELLQQCHMFVNTLEVKGMIITCYLFPSGDIKRLTLSDLEKGELLKPEYKDCTVSVFGKYDDRNMRTLARRLEECRKM